MNKDELDGLLALKVVGEKLNFAAAATELGISPPAMSQIIKNLESRLGVTLLTRTTRSASLTEAGKHFLKTASPAMDQLLLAIKDIGNYTEKPAGLLRLNAPTLLYPTYLKSLVASFTKKFPDLSVELCFENDSSDIFERGFDAGIRASEILALDMVAIKLFGPLKYVIVGSPKYLNKFGRPMHPKDLLNHNCIRIKAGDWTYDHWEFEHKGKAFEVQVKGSLIISDSILGLDAALEGTGLMYLTEDAVVDKIKSGKLEVVLSSYSATNTGYYLYFPKRSQAPSKLRAFIDHIRSGSVND